MASVTPLKTAAELSLLAQAEGSKTVRQNSFARYAAKGCRIAALKPIITQIYVPF